MQYSISLCNTRRRLLLHGDLPGPVLHAQDIVKTIRLNDWKLGREDNEMDPRNMGCTEEQCIAGALDRIQ
jgi:hypothetical protein